MIKASFYLSCIAISLCAFEPNIETPLEPGALLPKSDVSLTDISGKKITLAAAKGSNGLLVIFGSNICPYMVRNESRLQTVCQLARKNNIGVVIVNSNEAERHDRESLAAMQKYGAEQNFAWYYVVDMNAVLANAFDANHTPECYLFDKNSRLAYKGGIDDSPGNAEKVKVTLLQNAIHEVLAGKAVTVNSTSSLGCNIKRNL